APGDPPNCEACDPGEYCAGGTEPADPCAVDTFDDDADPGTECVAKTTCIAGHYVTDAGSAIDDRACSNCAAGTSTVDENETSCSDIDACDGTPVCTADYSCQDLPAPSTSYTCRGQFEDWTPSDSPATFTINEHGADDTVTDSRSGLE